MINDQLFNEKLSYYFSSHTHTQKKKQKITSIHDILFHELAMQHWSNDNEPDSSCLNFGLTSFSDETWLIYTSEQEGV